MLLSLTLKNLALIGELELEFCPGFNVISGETGAGKSLSVDALGLLLGARARNDWIKSGESSAEISASFTPNLETAQELLQEWELDANECLLRRVLKRDAESRNFINASPATLGQLKRLGLLLADIQAQGDHQSLLGKGAALGILDNCGGCSQQAQTLTRIYSHWQKQQRAWQQAQQQQGKSEQLRADLELEIAELQALGLGEGEFEALEQEYQQLANLQEGEENCAQALELLENDEGEGLLAACSKLQQLLTTSTDEQLPELVEQCQGNFLELKNSLRLQLEQLRASPERLEQIDQTLGQAHHLGRKYRCHERELWSLCARKREQLANIEQSGSQLEELATSVTQLESDYRELAQQLSHQRRTAAELLNQQVRARLDDLGISGPFQVELQASEPSSSGLESAEFMYAPHPDLPLQPLRRIASGGELARAALALQVVIAARNKLPTLVLDEVDVGIGGATASKVGAMLQELAQHSQIICVTHQPQVAACAARHWRVGKNAQAQIEVSLLDEEARVHELARMGGGSQITPTNLAAARELLEQALVVDS